MSDQFSMTASEQGRAIQRGDLDPIDVVNAYFDRIDGAADSVRTFTMLTKDRALAEAHAARNRAKAGSRLSPLDGVPISWKDLFDTAGSSTEAGSALLKGRVPDQDCVVLRNATQNGLVCMGKTHMSELAFSGLGLNPVTQTPPCINDPDAVPGGSSSGAATSVAFGFSSAAIGSDTGGSVRIPSAWNDLVGLKTTAGRVSLKGVVPLCESFDTVGPLCKSVEDAAHILAAFEGQKPIDLANEPLAARRFAVLDTVAFDNIRDEPAKAFDQAVQRLAKAGAKVERITCESVAEAMPLSAILFTSEAYGTWKQDIEKAPDLMFPEILARFRSGAEFTAADYVAAWQRLQALRQAYHDQTAGFDAVLVPTAPILPPNAQRLLEDQDYYVTENLLALRNTRIGNLMGTCAVTLPTDVPSCGLSLMGKPLKEEHLLRVSSAAERVLRG